MKNIEDEISQEAARRLLYVCKEVLAEFGKGVFEGETLHNSLHKAVLLAEAREIEFDEDDIKAALKDYAEEHGYTVTGEISVYPNNTATAPARKK